MTVEAMVKKDKNMITSLLFYLSRIFDNPKMHIGPGIKRKALADEVFDDSLMYIEDSIRYSTKYAFRYSVFF